MAAGRDTGPSEDEEICERCAFRIICPLQWRTNRGPGEERPPRSSCGVVRLPGGRRRVLAGAGSGKTYTMTELVRSHVDDHMRRLGGTAPEKILALTFTVKAAEEMRKRLLGALRSRPSSSPSPTSTPTPWRSSRRTPPSSACSPRPPCCGAGGPGSW